ncbi:MAG: PspC domain-containing protein [Prolixibacteraceae bacterium]|jgi:phage shock protein PspC (stress-responsive transcriptional regulator)
MKKTFTINISGSVFHIEEDAYERLHDYLQHLNSFFNAQAGGQEILQDIEARIAELLQEKMTDGKEAVTSEWVEEIMQRMGNPEDFTDQDESGTRTDEPKTEKSKKRMYRDTENRVLGGVCSGMGAYFKIDPVFLRILFVLLVFVGVGVSILVYIILWIVVPKASTTAQRLEMRGEEATISNIRKTIQEEVTEVKKSFSKISKSESFRKGKEAANKAGQASTQVFRGLGKVVGVFFGGMLILIGFLGFVSLIVSLAVGNTVFYSHGIGVNPDMNLSGVLGFMVSPGLVSVSILLLVLLVGIPLLSILFIGTKLVFRYKTNNKAIGLGAFGIWLVALVAMIFVTVGQVSNFSQKSSVSSGKSLDCPECKTLYLEAESSAETMNAEDNVHFEDITLIEMNGEKVLAGNPRLRIEPTDASDFSVIVRKQARGRNSSEVQGNLDHIQYNIDSRDSTLVLDRFFTIGNKGKWRSQEVQVIVKVPTGKMVHLGKNLNRLHFDFDNINNIWTGEMAGKTWKMTDEGLSLKE